MNNAVLLTFFAGVVGTLAGGLLGLKVNPDSSRSLSSLLAFSAGMMISMICFDLLPEALEEAGMPITVAGCALGVCLLLQYWIHPGAGRRLHAVCHLLRNSAAGHADESGTPSHAVSAGGISAGICPDLLPVKKDEDRHPLLMIFHSAGGQLLRRRIPASHWSAYQ